MPDDAEVVHNAERRRYELLENGSLAGFLQYRQEGGKTVLVHTEVLPGHEGRGHGGRLAKAALDEARANGTRIVPRCEFVAAYLQRHPEYADLVEPHVG